MKRENKIKEKKEGKQGEIKEDKGTVGWERWKGKGRHKGWDRVR